MPQPALRLIPLLAAGWLAAAEAPGPARASTWGAPGDRDRIAQAQRGGTPAAVAAAVAAAKRSRGLAVGSPERPERWTPVEPAAPRAEEVKEAWRGSRGGFLARLPADRPSPARGWGYVVLGFCAAVEAGEEAGPAEVDPWLDLAAATQYCDANAPWPPRCAPGLFALPVVEEGDPWFDRTPVGSSCLGRELLGMARSHPAAVATYDAGPWAGRRFLVADSDRSGWVDGGAAYDHGIAGAAMIAAALASDDPAVRGARLAAARLAADWAIAEPPVVNANYTAKLVWLLARMYALDGRAADRAALLDKLDRAVLPAILMDADRDGVVDGLPGVRFAQLAAEARTPGRLWDGHNARCVYHAMVAQAVAAAYAALRDRGDAREAVRVRPYACALLDSLAAEVNGCGVPGSGKGLVPFAMMHGLWLIDRAEGATTAAWREAVARLWAAGSFRSAGESCAALGLLLLETSGRPYRRAARPDQGG